MLAPAKMPVADGKKMENKPKKVPSGPRQFGTKFWAKISAGGEKYLSINSNLLDHFNLVSFILKAMVETVAAVTNGSWEATLQRFIVIYTAP